MTEHRSQEKIWENKTPPSISASEEEVLVGAFTGIITMHPDRLIDKVGRTDLIIIPTISETPFEV